MITQDEKKYLRELAKQYRELCYSEDNIKKRQKWYDINELKPNTNPVFMNHYWPLALEEVFPEETYICQDGIARDFEQYFKSKMFFALELDDDNVLEPVVYSRVIHDLRKFRDIDASVKHAGEEELSSMEINKGSSPRANESDAYEIVCVLEDEKDIEKLTDPILIYNKELTKQYYDEACEIFEPILKVIKQPMQFPARTSDEYSWLRGMENTYMDLYDDPDMMHNALDKICHNLRKRFEIYEEEGIWGTLDLSFPLASAGLRYVTGLPDYRTIENPFEYKCSLKDSWGFTTAEAFTCVSSQMHYEFDLEYNKKILEDFPYINIGCCEVLDKKIELCRRIPNTRKISVSEWCDPELAAKEIGNEYVYSYRAAGVHFVQDEWDKVSAEKEIRSVLESTKKYGCSVEIILNIGGTLQKHPRRKVMEWSRMVKELINEYYG